MKRILLHVDRLVLTGLGNIDQSELAEGLRQELATLLTGQGATGRLALHPHMARLRAGSTTVGHDDAHREIGARVARAIGRTLLP